MISLSNIFISDALAADAASGASAATNFASFVPLILIFVVFYFLLIRPQQKKIKEHQKMVNDLKINDKVSTSSGIFGVVKGIDQKENLIELEIAKEVIIKINRNSIGEVIKSK